MKSILILIFTSAILLTSCKSSSEALLIVKPWRIDKVTEVFKGDTTYYSVSDGAMRRGYCEYGQSKDGSYYKIVDREVWKIRMQDSIFRNNAIIDLMNNLSDTMHIYNAPFDTIIFNPSGNGIFLNSPGTWILNKDSIITVELQIKQKQSSSAYFFEGAMTILELNDTTLELEKNISRNGDHIRVFHLYRN